MSANNHPNRTKRVQLENAQRALAERTEQLEATTLQLELVMQACTRWQHRARVLAGHIRGKGVVATALDILDTMEREQTMNQNCVTTARSLKVARDALTDAKISRDAEAIREASVEFERCLADHGRAVAEAQGLQRALL